MGFCRVVFPEELDLRIRNPMNLLKTRGGKRGRPKKKPTKSIIVEDDSEEAKVEYLKYETCIKKFFFGR